MKIVMISAKSQHGKDAVAQIMKEELERRGEKVLIIHFGDPVKWIAREYYKWDGQKNETGRSLLQYIGTTMMRNFDIYYWGDIISKFIAAADLHGDFTYTIIPDWRFFSEKFAICSYNAEVNTIRITRTNPDGSLYRNPLMTDAQFTHVSEVELDSCHFDYYIDNNSDLNSLRKKVLTILEKIGEKHD